MTLNLTLEHFAGFLIASWFATIFFDGCRLVRVIAFTFLWQLLTPAREFWEDSLMLGAGIWITEYLYQRARKIAND